MHKPLRISVLDDNKDPERWTFPRYKWRHYRGSPENGSSSALAAFMILCSRGLELCKNSDTKC